MKSKVSLVTTFFLVLFLSSCSGNWIEPIVSNTPQRQYSSLGEYLSSVGCTQSLSLVGANLTLTRSKWNPNVNLESGPGFLSSFKSRYGIDYNDRRSPVEVETLIEIYEKVRAAIEINPGLLNLPNNYHLSEQDKTDLFYVSGPRGSLAIREVLAPILVKDEIIDIDPPIITPDLPPVVNPQCPECPQPVICPKPVSCPECKSFTLSSESLSTLDSISKWVIGFGRKSKVNKLVKEIKYNLRSTGQVNVVVVNEVH